MHVTWNVTPNLKNKRIRQTRGVIVVASSFVQKKNLAIFTKPVRRRPEKSRGVDHTGAAG
jgi:hypothetical protein